MEGEEKVRAFIAIDLPPAVTGGLRELQGKLIKGCTGKIAWVRPENIHLTLKFFGEVKEDKCKGTLDSLIDIASRYGPFGISVQGLGCFPRIESARVVWVGIESVGEGLLSLQKDIEKGMKRLGFSEEKRTYHPHLTLGRVKFLKERQVWKELIESLKDVRVGAFRVERIVFFKSTLKPTGAVYTKLGEAVLGSNL